MKQGRLGWLFCLLLALVPLHASAGTYAMTTLVSNWIDSSTHNKITTVSTPYKFTGGGSTGCGSTPPTLDDVISDPIPIGFNFMFGGVVFSSLRVMTNGRLQFGNASCGYGTNAIGPPQTFPYGYPDASMNYTMRIYGGDLDVTVRGSDAVSGYPTTCTDRNSCYVSYAMTGTAPNRSFIVTWNNVPEWVNYTQTAGNFNLQIILQENGEFIYQYGATNYASTGRAQIGWQVDTQDYDVSQVGLPPSGTAFKYYIPRPVAEYRMEQPTWMGVAREILDTSGNGRHASRVGGANTVANVPGCYICRGGNIPSNPNTNTIDAIGTPINVTTDVGSSGTITFWYKPVTWSGASAKEAVLFDATTASNEYFYLAKTMSGSTPQLLFVIRDSSGTTRTATVAAPTLNASGAVHIGVTWSFNPLAAANSDFLRVYVNGVKAAESLFTTSAGISASLGTLYIGDNRSGNSAYGRSADGVIDEFRIYNYAGALGLILRDMNQANVCLDHYAIQHAGTGYACTVNPVTVQAHTSTHGLVVMPNNTTMIRLSTSSGLGDWSLISGYGVLNNGATNDGQATYIFNGEYQAVFGLTHTNSGVVNINVTDGQIGELAGEDPNLVLSPCGLAALNACEKTAPQCVPDKSPDSTYDHLFTKLADTAFDLDFVALKSDGKLDSSFNGQVDVSLLANLSPMSVDTSTNCPTAVSTATVALGLLTFANGRATKNVPANAFSSVSPNYRAYKDVRVKFACSAANCGRVINVCSTDSFTVRPQGLSIAVTKNDGTALVNTSITSGLPSLMAGADFLIKATGVAGYNGAPTIKRTVADQTVASHLSSTDYVGNLRDASGNDTISLGSATVASGLSTGTVQYHDYGQFRLKAGAVRDSSYAGDDGTKGDCIVGSSSNTAVGGRFGCDVANQADTGLFGRFYPSYFVASGTLTPACLEGNFSYFGQPFVLTYSVTAKSFPNPQLGDTATMTRYSAGTVAVGLYDGTRTVDLSGNIAPSPSTGAWLNGIFAPTVTSDVYTRGATPVGPVEAGYMAIKATDPDGATIGRATGVQTTVSDTDFAVGVPTCISGCTHKKINRVPTRFRYGRVWLGNANGSELLNLPLDMRIQYWAGARGWQPHTEDTCTLINESDFAFSFPSSTKNQLSPCSTAIALSGTAPSYKAALIKPGVVGWTDVTLNLGTVATGNRCTSIRSAGPAATTANTPWLQFNWTGSVDNPIARATFGVYKSSPLIYRREMYH